MKLIRPYFRQKSLVKIEDGSLFENEEQDINTTTFRRREKVIPQPYSEPGLPR